MHKSFYYQFYPVLMRVCIRYAPNREDAEQWVHDAFLKIFDQLEKYSFKGSFEGWLKKITARICLDNIRKHRALKFSIENNLVLTGYEDSDFYYSVDNQFMSKISAESTLSMLSQLSEKKRIVFNLHVFEEFSQKEIAQILDIRENYVYWLMHQARKDLQDILQSFYKKEAEHEKQ